MTTQEAYDLDPQNSEELIDKSPLLSSFAGEKVLVRDQYWVIRDPDGFDFGLARWVCEGDEGPQVEVFAKGSAFYDGIRHVWMKYVYYPDIEAICDCMKKAKELYPSTIGA